MQEKHAEGTLIQVIPNFSGDNELVGQLISFIHDISDNKIAQLKQHRKSFMNIRKTRENVKTLFTILSRQPFAVSYEIFSDENKTSFNFWIPTQIKDSFIKKIYSVWDGSQIKVLEKDYVDFDVTKTNFATIKFANHSILPLSTGKHDEPLPLLIQHLEQLEGDEKALIQFVMQPVRNKWQGDAVNAYKKLKEGHPLTNNKVKAAIYSLFNFLGSQDESPDTLLRKESKIKSQEILSKLNQNGINMNIRLAVQADSRQRSMELTNGIVNAFKALEGIGTAHNKFVKKDLLPYRSEKFLKQLQERKVPLVTINHKDIWVSPEITKIISQPNPDIFSNKIERVNVRQTRVDETLKQDTGLRMGQHSFNGKTHTIYWEIDDMDTVMRPTVVIANPGEGKTEMLISKFLDWIKLGYGGAVIDVADGKLVDKILYKMPTSLKDKVYLIDANDLENPPAISDFTEVKGGDREISNMLTQMWTEFFIHFFGIEDHHRSKDFIRKSSVPIFSFEGNTILEQYNMIANEEFRLDFMEKLSGNRRLLRYKVWWDKFNNKPAKVKEEETKAILNKFEVIMDNEILKNMICQRNSKLPKFRDLMDQKKIILIKASEGIGYGTSKILGALLLMKFWMAALSRHDQDVKDRVPFKIFCDEPQNYIASANYVKEMLAKSRKYRLGLELYFQDPIQIEEANKGLLKLLVSMNPHLILGKMGDNQYEKYFKHRIKPLAPSEGAVLPKHHWIVSMYKDKEAVQPFIMEAVPMVPDPDKAEIGARTPWIKELKRRTSTPVDVVEDDILIREMPELAEYDAESSDLAEGVSGVATQVLN
jgi:hypothetical protein